MNDFSPRTFEVLEARAIRFAALMRAFGDAGRRRATLNGVAFQAIGPIARSEGVDVALLALRQSLDADGDDRARHLVNEALDALRVALDAVERDVMKDSISAFEEPPQAGPKDARHD